MKTIPDILRAGNAWINDCKRLNMDVTQIHSLVTQLYNKKFIVKSGNGPINFSRTIDEELNLEVDNEHILDITGGENVV